MEKSQKIPEDPESELKDLLTSKEKLKRSLDDVKKSLDDHNQEVQESYFLESSISQIDKSMSNKMDKFKSLKETLNKEAIILASLEAEFEKKIMNREDAKDIEAKLEAKQDEVN